MRQVVDPAKVGQQVEAVTAQSRDGSVVLVSRAEDDGMRARRRRRPDRDLTVARSVVRAHLGVPSRTASGFSVTQPASSGVPAVVGSLLVISPVRIFS